MGFYTFYWLLCGWALQKILAGLCGIFGGTPCWLERASQTLDSLVFTVFCSVALKASNNIRFKTMPSSSPFLRSFLIVVQFRLGARKRYSRPKPGSRSKRLEHELRTSPLISSEGNAKKGTCWLFDCRKEKAQRLSVIHLCQNKPNGLN